MEGAEMGETNGTDAWMMPLLSAMLGSFVRGGGTWVFLGSTSI